MTEIRKPELSPNATIREALSIIDEGAIRFAVVVDPDSKLLGTITDGDIRRAILNGYNLDDSIENIYFRNPVTVTIDTPKDEIVRLCTSKKLYQIPILDHEGHILSIAVLDELLQPRSHPNRVILMVGGLGTRLRPLTQTTPKPMLHVGGKPILQTIVERFAASGFTNIVMCVNYKSHLIKEHFGNGEKFGVSIEYIEEKERMGTAGALSLLKERPEEPFFVMNGDLLTNIDFENMLEYHLKHEAAATMTVREYDLQIPYGVVNIENGNVTSIEEKPVQKFFVSAGIYMLSPESLDFIPPNSFFDMPMLLNRLIDEGKKTVSFPLREYWLDIGRMEEYERANREYSEVFCV